MVSVEFFNRFIAYYKEQRYFHPQSGEKTERTDSAEPREFNNNEQFVIL